jgi:host factor-I protein
MNRKLMRPNLSEIKEQMSQEKEREKAADRGGDRPVDRGGDRRKMHPPTDTFAESYYYLKQMNKKTPMTVVFTDGQVVEGVIEWYDRNCIKLNRDNAPNLLIYKGSIRCLYKAGDTPGPAGDESKKKK